jgi:glucose/arabinose dehydrogenase
MKKITFILLAVSMVLLSASDNRVMQEVIKLPAGFTMQLFAEDLGTARHIAVTPQGIVYVKLGKLNDGNGIVMLQDVDKKGKAEKKTTFGPFAGTGIAVKGNYLFASSDSEVFRYTLDANGMVTNKDKPELIVRRLVNRNQHSSKSIALDSHGNLYVNIGAPSNACQEVDRTKGSKGMMPCPILDSAGGIWQFNAALQNQSYANGKRYATGLRNVVGLDWNTETDQLYVMQHGRDMLFQLYPEYFDAKQSAELPSEVMFALKQGDDGGWPYVYYDHIQKKKILAPEFGGDGKKTGGEKAIDPVVAFPGHLAPNALLFYKGSMFPEHYRNGAFVAFHGSWNRAPEKQKGYFVAFVPFKGGKPAGEWEIFADGFAGVESIDAPGQARHRPSGLAEGPDGALYVTDDVTGHVYKITYAK